MRTGTTCSQRLSSATGGIEAAVVIDRLEPTFNALAAPFNRPPLADALRGKWLGHALHPLLTDVPLGCWIAALTLDLFPGRRRASQTLVGAGVAAVPITVAAGLAEWGTLHEERQRRVATVHAIGNLFVGMAFLRSWVARRHGAQRAGVLWSLGGGVLALVTGYLGGHMSFVQGAGSGRR